MSLGSPKSPRHLLDLLIMLVLFGVVMGVLEFSGCLRRAERTQVK
jgi:hypothetical protein